MIQDKTQGQLCADYCTRILTKEFRIVFQARPEKLIAFFSADHESPEDERIWDEQKRATLHRLITNESEALVEAMNKWMGQDVFDLSKLKSVWSVEESK
jgi:hypothetical protein